MLDVLFLHSHVIDVYFETTILHFSGELVKEPLGEIRVLP